ncbi:MAG: type IV secretory system conjugative DNA transfer family protein [Patescibacteria group bacterium]
MVEMKDKDKIYFAETDFRGQKTPFGIKLDDRARHVYVIGKTGMGKSTTLENMAIQDIQNGHGLAFIDPHGSTAEKLLDYVPPERVKDVIYFAPFDLDHPISFNVMEDVGKDQRHLVVSGLMSAFKKIWVDAWSARMEYILTNILLALLEYPGSTLLGVNRMLADRDYRKKVVDNITDPGVRAFWVDEFAKYTERFAAEATPAIQNKVGQFTSNPLIRNIIGQAKSSLNFRQIMDGQKILIVNLSKGRMGESNANLLGSMLITKLYLTAMSRAGAAPEEMRRLPPFYLFVDEFQSFANESFANILSEARKYKLSLTMAHQYIEQMSEEVRAAVFGNVGTIIVFRVGPFDAEVLEKIFAPTFTQEDIVNLGFAQIYLTLMIDGVGSPPFSAVTLAPIPLLQESNKEKIIVHGRESYAEDREVVEKKIVAWHESEKPTSPRAATAVPPPRSVNPAPSRASAVPPPVVVRPASSSPNGLAAVRTIGATVSLNELRNKPSGTQIRQEAKMGSSNQNKEALKASLQKVLSQVPPTSNVFTPAPPAVADRANQKEVSREELEKMIAVPDLKL